MAVTVVPGAPDLVRVKAWLGPAAAALSDEDLQMMLDGAVNTQATYCHVPAPDSTTELLAPELVEALLRRVARAVASKGLPLGVLIGDTEYAGAITVRRWDAEIESREEPHRVWGVA